MSVFRVERLELRILAFTFTSPKVVFKVVKAEAIWVTPIKGHISALLGLMLYKNVLQKTTKKKPQKKNKIAKSVIRPSLLVTRLLADEMAVFKFPCVFSAVLMGIPRTTPRSENKR